MSGPSLEPIDADAPVRALYGLFHAVCHSSQPFHWDKNIKAALEEAERALQANAEGWPETVRVRIMDRPGRWAHLKITARFDTGFVIEVERYEDAVKVDTPPPPEPPMQVEDVGGRYCVHGRVPLGDWCRECNPLRR